VAKPQQRTIGILFLHHHIRCGRRKSDVRCNRCVVWKPNSAMLVTTAVN